MQMVPVVVGKIYEAESVLVDFGPENAQEYEYFVENCYGIDIDEPYEEKKSKLELERSLKHRLLSFHEAYYLCSMQEKRLHIILNEDEVDHKKEYSLKELWLAFSSMTQSFQDFMVVYHHFRLEGWRIKSGLNYGGHFVLYSGSPDEFHSEYLVYIILSEEGQQQEGGVSWHTIQTLTRIAEDVKKTLLLCQVTKETSHCHEEQKQDEVETALDHSIESDKTYIFHDKAYNLDVLPIRFWDMNRLEDKTISKATAFDFQPQQKIPKKKQKTKRLKQQHHKAKE